jgi:hypothetical protein
MACGYVKFRGNIEMSYYQEIDSAKDVFLTGLLETERNELQFTLAIGQLSDFNEDVFISGKSSGPARRIEITDSSPHFNIRFDSYICYNVINESFVSLGREEFAGNKIRVYTDSSFLKYVNTDTFATKDYPGELKHFCFISLNHIINVASVSEPRIEIIK